VLASFVTTTNYSFSGELTLASQKKFILVRSNYKGQKFQRDNMGRVARYKKVKKTLAKATPSGGERLSISSTVKNLNSGSDYFDTVGVWGLVDSGRKPKKRSRTSLRLRAQRNKKGAILVNATDCFDLACTDGDDFDIHDPVGTLKKHAVVPEATCAVALKPSVVSLPLNSQAATTNALTTDENSSLRIPAAAVPSIDVEEEKLHKKLETQVLPKIPLVASEGRMLGESKRAYSKRVKKETRQIIQRANQLDRNPEKRQKKKAFLTMKKKSGRKRKNAGLYSDDDDAVYFDTDVYHSKLLTAEQAVAARDRATRVQFGEQAERPPIFKELPRGAAKIKKQKISLTDFSDIKEEKRALELVRTKMQAQYATIKARRKLNGEFHL
jgi:hypothetical protein